MANQSTAPQSESNHETQNPAEIPESGEELEELKDCPHLPQHKSHDNAEKCQLR